MATADLTHAFETLLTNIRNLALDDSYKTIAGVFDEIPRLNALIESKDTELSTLKHEITELKGRHEHRLQEDLELYRTQRNKLEEEKLTLAGTISTLEATITKNDAASAEHTRTQNVLQGQLDHATALLGTERGKIAALNMEITELQHNIKGKDVGIDKLKECLKNEKTQNSKSSSMVQDLKKEIASLQENLHSCTTKLDEIDSFTTNLEELDDTVW